MEGSLNLKIVITLTIGFTLASFLGYVTQRMKLSPILGYLLAGYMIGPFFPGFVADLQLAEQLAEVGVMLMMFSVGLHFKWQDLVVVKKIALPGAIGQTVIATLVATLLVSWIGGPWQVGLIIGLAIGVASTVVLVRVLADHHLLNTLQGYIAVGWLIVEDILTVAVLILLPTIVALLSGATVSWQEVLTTLSLLLVKITILAGFMFTLGRKFVSYVLFKIARTRSPELFTLTVLALTFLIAISSTFLFGASIALGAFIAGMVIGQTNVSHQASAYASPMKDVFAVIFFLSVGMLFNPMAIVQHFSLFLAVLTVILIVKPLAALAIMKVIGYPLTISLGVALALAQIGEFSFILAEEAGKYHIFPDEAYDIIVACALISISLNPLFFKFLEYLNPYLLSRQPIAKQTNSLEQSNKNPKALVVGFGLIGYNIANVLKNLKYQPVFIEKDVDRVAKLHEENQEAIYGEATFPDLLKSAQLESIELLMINIQRHFDDTLSIIQYAREIRPQLPIIARVQSLEEQKILSNKDIKVICDEEEICQAFHRLLIEIKKEIAIKKLY